MQLGYSASLQSPNVCMLDQNCSLGLFYLLQGTNLARNILGQSPSSLILLALCSICLFLHFQYSFHPSPASFSGSAVLTMSCSAFCCGTNIRPSPSLSASQELKEATMLWLHPLRRAIPTTKASFVRERWSLREKRSYERLFQPLHFAK